MIPCGRYDQSFLRLSRDEQVATVRRNARQASEDLGHAIGRWRHAGLVADDDAMCHRCGGRLFIAYGTSALQPMVGARVFGTAFGSRCQS